MSPLTLVSAALPFLNVINAFYSLILPEEKKNVMELRKFDKSFDYSLNLKET